MSDAQYQDRLSAALRGMGVIASGAQVEALAEAVRQIVAEELASLGGHLLGHYSIDPATLTSAADPQAEQQAAALATLGGYLLEHYGRA